MLYLGIVLYGPSLALAAVTSISVKTSILVVGFCCVFYTSMGGIKAVIWTDVLQMAVMVVGIVLVLAKGTADVGGMDKVWKIADQGARIQLLNVEFDPYRHTNFWNALFGFTLMWASYYGTNQIHVQRFANLPTIRQAQTSLLLNIPGLFIILTMACLCGLVIYANYAHCDPITNGHISRYDELMPYFVMDRLNIPGIPGLFVATVFSGSLSTLSSGFNSFATLTWDDFLQPWMKVTGIRAVLVTKIIAALYGVLAIGCAFICENINSIIRAGFKLTVSFIGPLFSVFFVGVMFPFCNRKGALWGTIIGEVFSLILVTGSLIYPEPYWPLPNSIDGCSWNRTDVLNFTRIPTYDVDQVPRYEPRGMMRLYHLAFVVTPVITFLVSFIASVEISLITGSTTEDDFPPKLVHPCVRNFPSWLRPRTWDKEFQAEKATSDTFEKYSINQVASIRPYVVLNCNLPNHDECIQEDQTLSVRLSSSPETHL